MTSTKGLLDPGFRGGRLVPAEGSAPSQAALDVQRAKDLPQALDLDARAFGAELQRLVQDLREVTVAEFLITAIDGDGDRQISTPPSATTSSAPGEMRIVSSMSASGT